MSDYKVWYIPQVPGKPFEVRVNDLPTARLILDTLTNFSGFEFEHRVKPDYCDAGGISILDHEGDWIDVDEDDEEFCEVCYAGLLSSEHSEKCERL